MSNPQKPTNELTLRERAGSIVESASKSVERSLAFFDLDSIGQAELDAQFDVSEFITSVLRDIRSDDPKVRSAARREFWKIKKDAAAMNGLIGNTRHERKVVRDDGAEDRMVVTSQRLLSNLKGSNANRDNRNRVSPHQINSPEAANPIEDDPDGEHTESPSLTEEGDSGGVPDSGEVGAPPLPLTLLSGNHGPLGAGPDPLDE